LRGLTRGRRREKQSLGRFGITILLGFRCGTVETVP
jgi:hypothetical protein